MLSLYMLVYHNMFHELCRLEAVSCTKLRINFNKYHERTSCCIIILLAQM